MQSLFSIRRGQTELGEHDLSHIVQMLSVGELNTQDSLYLEDRQDWLALGEFGPIKKRLEIMAKLQAQKTENKVSQEASVAEVKSTSEQVLSADLKMLGFKNGEARFIVSHDVSEKIEILVVSEDLKIKTQEAVQVKAGRAVRLDVLHIPSARAGEEINIHFRAVDQFGNLDVEFSGKVSVSLRDQEMQQASLSEGIGQAQISLQKAGTHRLSFAAGSLLGESEILVKSGAAAQILIETIESAQAGEKFSVVCRAVDQFGNLVEDFNETMNLEVKNSKSQITPKVMAI